MCFASRPLPVKLAASTHLRALGDTPVLVKLPWLGGKSMAHACRVSVCRLVGMSGTLVASSLPKGLDYYPGAC